MWHPSGGTSLRMHSSVLQNTSHQKEKIWEVYYSQEEAERNMKHKCNGHPGWNSWNKNGYCGEKAIAETKYGLVIY